MRRVLDIHLAQPTSLEMKCRLVALLFLLTLVGHALANDSKPNVLFIAIDDLRCDLGAFGVSHAKTPNLDALANSSRIFTHHYVQVPTCGASRCALMRGKYPSLVQHLSNAAMRQTYEDWGKQSMPAVFRSHGYQTLAVGKITHHPGGLAGKDWAEGPEELPGAWDRAWVPAGPWKSPEAIMHGYANGVARVPGKSPLMEDHDGPDDAYPDAWVASEAISTLRQLATQKQHWFFGVGFFKPHLPFAAPKKWHDLHAGKVPDLDSKFAIKPTWPSGWHNSGEFRSNYGHAANRDPDHDLEYARQVRTAYAACISYMDAQVGRVLRELSELGLDKETIVVVWSDHGFLLGEHAIWGKHCLYEPSLKSPLMIRLPAMTQPGARCDATVESVDLFPTLAELCGLPVPKDLDGRSLSPFLADPTAAAIKPAHSFWNGGQRTVRTDRWRLTALPSVKRAEQVYELFDCANDPGETTNLAISHPEIVQRLTEELKPVPANKAR